MSGGFGEDSRGAVLVSGFGERFWGRFWLAAVLVVSGWGAVLVSGFGDKRF